MAKTIWITGASGRLGAELIRRLKANPDYKIIGTDKDTDITDMTAVDKAADVYRPNVIINCASLSDTAYCEENMVDAFRVNALGARNLAAASRRQNARIIQMSTDDVFDGKLSGRHTEFDAPEPRSVYGRSKLAGENFVRELNPKHLIIRSSWVYGLRTADGDFMSMVLEKGKNGEHFSVPMDVISSPTDSRLLSEAVEALMDKGEYGVFHASCEGVCSRHEFAKAILQYAGFDPSLAEAEYSESGKASSTLLENLMMKMTGVFEMPDWKEELESFMKTKEVK